MCCLYTFFHCVLLFFRFIYKELYILGRSWRGSGEARQVITVYTASPKQAKKKQKKVRKNARTLAYVEKKQ